MKIKYIYTYPYIYIYTWICTNSRTPEPRTVFLCVCLSSNDGAVGQRTRRIVGPRTPGKPCQIT